MVAPLVCDCQSGYLWLTHVWVVPLVSAGQSGYLWLIVYKSHW